MQVQDHYLAGDDTNFIFCDVHNHMDVNRVMWRFSGRVFTRNAFLGVHYNDSVREYRDDVVRK